MHRIKNTLSHLSLRDRFEKFEAKNDAKLHQQGVTDARKEFLKGLWRLWKSLEDLTNPSLDTKSLSDLGIKHEDLLYNDEGCYVTDPLPTSGHVR
jgi:hypothetical protein